MVIFEEDLEVASAVAILGAQKHLQGGLSETLPVEAAQGVLLI